MDELPTQSPNTSSFQQEVTSSLTYETKGENRLVTVLYKKVEQIERELYDLKVKKILDETQLPLELLAHNNLLPSIPRRLKRGRGYRPILRSEIEEAKKYSIFGSQQAKFLGVKLPTYRKYAKLHGLWEPQPHAKGRDQQHNPNIGKYPLPRILTGEFDGNPAVSDWMVKRKLLRSGTFPECCNICGYNKRRITDKYVSLIVDHKDGDKSNFKLENLRLLCWNCTIECGRGYLRRGFHTFDPDWRNDAKTG